MKIDTTIIDDVNAFCDLVDEKCKGEFDIVFSYRVRIAIK
jgi:hypothetical protein